MIREEFSRLFTVGERHRRLFARLVIAFGLSIVVFAVGTVLVWVFESGQKGGNIHGFGDAAFFCSVQLLTVSSSMTNPVTSAGKIIDVGLEAWAIFVVTAVAGSFATFFSTGDASLSASPRPWALPALDMRATEAAAWHHPVAAVDLGGVAEFLGRALTGFLGDLQLRLHCLEVAIAFVEVVFDSTNFFAVLLQAGTQLLLGLRGPVQSVLSVVQGLTSCCRGRLLHLRVGVGAGLGVLAAGW